MESHESGKIDNQFFKSRIFPFCGKVRAEVSAGPQFGVDVAVIRIGNGMAVALTSDPLSLIPGLGLKESAWLSVYLMANDMATTGFAPMYGQFVLNLPVTLSAGDFEVYWRHIHEYCTALGVAITGGHTGRFEGMNATVSGGGTLMVVAPEHEIITSKGATPGDIVIMTRECAMLATSILAKSFPKTVGERCGTDILERAKAMFWQTSAVEAGLIAGNTSRRYGNAVTAMHDVTEGGIVGALYELAHASDCVLEITPSTIPVGDVQRRIGGLFSIDPLYCVGAGAMLITVKPGAAEALQRALGESGIAATPIGTVTGKGAQVVNLDAPHQDALTPRKTDPYWEAFYHAFNNGWK